MTCVHADGLAPGKLEQVCILTVPGSYLGTPVLLEDKQ